MQVFAEAFEVPRSNASNTINGAHPVASRVLAWGILAALTSGRTAFSVQDDADAVFDRAQKGRFYRLSAAQFGAEEILQFAWLFLYPDSSSAALVVAADAAV